MPFVKLDTGILDSTLWVDQEARTVFITALLMAVPREFKEPIPQIAVSELTETGFVAPPGWYGYVGAAGPGIVARSLLEQSVGMAALKRLGDPDDGSRTSQFDGRRLIRIDGGYLVLNYMLYRDKDHTAAIRSKRYRDKKALQRDGVIATRDNTQAEAYAEADTEEKTDNLAAKPRERNLLMDALASACGIPLSEISPVASRLGKVLRALKQATPELTPSDIQVRAVHYRSHFKDAVLTPEALQKHWGLCHAPKSGLKTEGEYARAF